MRWSEQERAGATELRDFFRDKKVALLGAGIENIAVIPWLLKAGAKITVRDHAIKDDRRIKLRQYPDVELIDDSGELDHLHQYDFVFRIAGLPVEKLEAALSKNKQRPIVTSPTDLFLALRPCRIIGVTGTKGKGTTSSLLGSILHAAGKHSVVVGNIGKPIFEVFDTLGPNSVVVLELSSFQLEDLAHSPEIAIVLPISPDHLQPLSAVNPNYHKTMNDYVAAKSNITLHQRSDELLVFAADNDFANGIARVSKAGKIAVSQLDRSAEFFVDRGGQVSDRTGELVNLQELGLRGQHIFLDATVAIAAASVFNVKREHIEVGIRTFQPLSHRLEEFTVKKGVLFVDDSYATTPHSALAAIQAYEKPIVWIGGGSSKGADFDELAQAIGASTVKSIILIGQESSRIAKALEGSQVRIPVIQVKTLAEAVGQAISKTHAGDVVLLSPGCASTDMFASAAERGELFKKAVNALSV